MSVDPVALVSAATALVTAVLGASSFWEYLKERGRRRDAERQRRETEKAVLKTGREDGLLALEAVYALEKYAVSVEFDDRGEGRVVKTWGNLRVRKATTNLSIPFENWVTCPGGALLEPEATEPENSPNPVTLSNVMRSPERVHGSVVVNGYLAPATSVTFGVVQPFHKAYCLTREEVGTAYAASEWKMEYASVPVTVPANLLEIEVRFPPSHEGIRRPQVVAFVGGTETVLSDATDDLRDSLKFENRVASVVVPAPAIGVSYAISWMPPSAGRNSK